MKPPILLSTVVGLSFSVLAVDVTTKRPEQLVPGPDATFKQLKLHWLSCGNKDGLNRTSQGVQTYLKEENVSHVWHVDDDAHDFKHWKMTLSEFAQLAFR